jgi:hypothetical protein
MTKLPDSSGVLTKTSNTFSFSISVGVDSKIKGKESNISKGNNSLFI